MRLKAALGRVDLQQLTKDRVLQYAKKRHAAGASRPTMRFVTVKRPVQVDMQALNRVRDRLSYDRTRLISKARSFRLEFGIPIRTGAGVF
jgi:transposase